MRAGLGQQDLREAKKVTNHVCTGDGGARREGILDGRKQDEERSGEEGRGGVGEGADGQRALGEGSRRGRAQIPPR